MKFFISVTFLLLFLTSLSISQPSQIVDDSFYSPSLQETIPLKIYLPPNHSTTAEPYRVYIFLHGASGSNYASHVYTIKTPLDQLISNPQLDFQPLVVIWANIQWSGLGGGVNSYNRHHYSNSIRNGSYEDVISVDLLNWIDTCAYNLSNVREKRAIGGYSMGGGGCVRIAICNTDKFIAFVSHCGDPAAQELRSMLSVVLGETPIVGGQYQFHPANGYFSAWWFCLSAAWSPNLVNPNQPAWQLDFPVRPDDGTLIPEIFDSLWIKHHDPSTLIQTPSVYTDSVFMYFDTRIADANKPFNDTFHEELNNLRISHVYNIFPTGGHQMSPDAAETGLMFLDSVMDITATTNIEKEIVKVADCFELKQNYPNPFNPITNIEFTLPTNSKITLKIYDLTGREVAVILNETRTAGHHRLTFNGSGYASGIYYYKLKVGQEVQARKFILIK
jgi:S-formylglutathione hydrolase FrmB